MPQARITRVDHDDATGSVQIFFGKSGLTFQSMEHVKIWVEREGGREALQALAVRAAIKKAPTLRNAAVVNGTRVKIEFDDPNPIEVT